MTSVLITTAMVFVASSSMQVLFIADAGPIVMAEFSDVTAANGTVTRRADVVAVDETDVVNERYRDEVSSKPLGGALPAMPLGVTSEYLGKNLIVTLTNSEKMSAIISRRAKRDSGLPVASSTSVRLAIENFPELFTPGRDSHQGRASLSVAGGIVRGRVIVDALAERPDVDGDPASSDGKKTPRTNLHIDGVVDATPLIGSVLATQSTCGGVMARAVVDVQRDVPQQVLLGPAGCVGDIAVQRVVVSNILPRGAAAVNAVAISTVVAARSPTSPPDP